MFAPVRSTMFATANKQTCDFGLPKSVFLATSLWNDKEVALRTARRVVSRHSGYASRKIKAYVRPAT
jgi:hypothetical protein